MRRKAHSLEGEEEQQEELNPRDQKRSRTCLEGSGVSEGEPSHRTNDGVTTVTIPEELWADTLRFLWESSSSGSWHCSRSAELPRLGNHHERLSHNAVLQPYILQRQLDEQEEEAGVDVEDQKPKTSTNVKRKKTSGECFFADKGACNLKPLLQARAVCRLFKRLVDGMTGMDVLQPFAERVLARVTSPPSFFVSPHREDGGQGTEATEGVSSRWGWPWSQQQSEEGRVDPQQALKVLSKAVMPAIKARFYACSLQARVEECLSQWWKPRFSSSSQLQQAIKRAQHLIQSRALRLIHLEREEDRLDISYALGIRAVLLISLSKLHVQPQGEEEEEDIDNEEESERQEEEDLVIALDVVQGWDYRDEAWDMGFFMRARLPSPPSSTLQGEATNGWRKVLGIKQEEQTKKERSEQKEDMEAEEEEGKNAAKENDKQEATEELTAPLVILTVSRGSGEPTDLNKPLLRRLWQLLFQTNNSEKEEEEVMEAERSMFEFLSLCSSFFWKLDLDHVWLTRDEEEPYWSEPVQWMLNNKKEEEKGKQAAQQTSRASLRRGKPASALAESENLGFIDLTKQPEDPDWEPSKPDTIAAVMKDNSLKEARAMLATLDKQHHLLSEATAEERYLWMYRQARCLQANIVASSSLVESPLLCFSRFCGFSNLSVDSGEYSGLTVTRSSSILFSRPSSPSCNGYRVKLEAKEKNGNCYGDSCDSHSLTLTSTLNTFAMLLSESLRCAVQTKQHEENGGKGGEGEEKLTVIVKYDKDVPTHPLEDEEEDGKEKEAESEKNDSTCIPLHSLFQLPPSSSTSSPQPTTNETLLRHLLLGLGLRMLGIAPDANHDRERAEHEDEVREQKVTNGLWDLVRMLEQEPSATPFSADALWQQCIPFFRRASY